MCACSPTNILQRYCGKRASCLHPETGGAQSEADARACEPPVNQDVHPSIVGSYFGLDFEALEVAAVNGSLGSLPVGNLLDLSRSLKSQWAAAHNSRHTEGCAHWRLAIRLVDDAVDLLIASKARPSGHSAVVAPKVADLLRRVLQLMHSAPAVTSGASLARDGEHV